MFVLLPLNISWYNTVVIHRARLAWAAAAALTNRTFTHMDSITWRAIGCYLLWMGLPAELQRLKWRPAGGTLRKPQLNVSVLWRNARNNQARDTRARFNAHRNRNLEEFTAQLHMWIGDRFGSQWRSLFPFWGSVRQEDRLQKLKHH